MPTLILTPRFTTDAQILWRTAGHIGWEVQRLSSWRVPEAMRSIPNPVLYVEALFGPTLAEQFGLRLLEPAIDWLPRLPEAFRKRWLYLTTLGQARQRLEPAFVKPANDKSFLAGIYTGAKLPVEYDDASPVLVAEIVTWEKEFRCFVLNRCPRTLSLYLRNGQLQHEYDFTASDAEQAEAEAFVRVILADLRVDLPTATVLDVGVIVGRGWAVVEQNAAWGAGIYGCDPEQALAVIRCATVPLIVVG